MTRKRLFTTIIILAILYFGVLPRFWPEPEIGLSVPSGNGSPNINIATLTIHTWHSNIALLNVYGVFELDPDLSNGEYLFTYNLTPEKGQRKQPLYYSSFGINRLTWPRTYRFRLDLPIEELRAKTDSEYVEGRIRAVLRYPFLLNTGGINTHKKKFAKNIVLFLE